MFIISGRLSVNLLFPGANSFCKTGLAMVASAFQLEIQHAETVQFETACVSVFQVPSHVCVSVAMVSAL